MLDEKQISDSVAQLKRQLIVEQLDTDLYRGEANPQVPGRVFGGQVIAQALAAATGSIGDARSAHSLHAYFLRAGDNARPIIYRVLRDFDGGSFANRRVVAMQDGKPILNLAASFQRPEHGLSHQAEMPPLPGPDDAVALSRMAEHRMSKLPEAIVSQLAIFNVRFGKSARTEAAPSGVAMQHAWFRLDPRFGSELSRVALAYISDFGLISTAILPHGMPWFTPEIQGASLDHTMWFHADPPLGEWLLYAMESPWAGHARGFARGTIYDQEGRLIASMAQEGLMRHRPIA